MKKRRPRKKYKMLHKRGGDALVGIRVLHHSENNEKEEVKKGRALL